MYKNLIWIWLFIVLFIGTNTGFSQTLPNGIVLPRHWPPNYEEPAQRQAMQVPYLVAKPAVIPVNSGRQLLVDSFLIESTNLKIVNHPAVYHGSNPVLQPDREWESNGVGPYAAPFSDGAWYDEKDQKYKMWYLSGKPNRGKQAFQTCYAESSDGVNWVKPDLQIFGHTNIVDTAERDASTVWIDKLEQDAGRRFKMFSVEKRDTDGRWQMLLKYSADGKYWGKAVAQSGDLYDRTTVFYNAISRKWVISMRHNAKTGRARTYLEAGDAASAVSLAHRVRKDAGDAHIVYWFGADDQDPHHPLFPGIEPQIYNHDAIAYESILLNYFSVWQGPENNLCDSLGIQKRNEVLIGFSRDGFHISRPSHIPFMGVHEAAGAWNWGNVQSVAGLPIIKGDSLYFYVSGRRLNKKMWDAYTSTGLASLRRDGFVSLQTKDKGFLLTPTLSFQGNYFFVNADVKGELRVALLDRNNHPIPGYSAEDCIAMKGNSTQFLIRWKQHRSVSEVKGKRVKLKFYLSDGDLYSFWISKWITGQSNGYTAGGGPGLHVSGIDTK